MRLFNTSYETTIPAPNMPEEALLSTLAIACDYLSWTVGYASPHGLIVRSPRGSFSNASEITIRVMPEGVYIKSANTDNALVDWGRNKKLVNSFIDVFSQQQTVQNEEHLAAKYEELKAQFLEEEDYLSPGVYEEYNKKGSFIELFKPTHSYAATPVIALLNILVYIVMVASGVDFMVPDGESILTWGGNYGPATLQGEWWRIFTSTFLHIGILHLVMNLYGLFVAGNLLERLIGTKRFIVVYLLSGVTASVLSLYWHPDTLSAGASGAIFGLFGALIAMLSTNILPKPLRMTLLPNMAIFVGYNLFMGMKEGVDNAAHIGGLIGGLGIGYAFFPTMKEGASVLLKNMTIAVLCIVVAGVVLLGFTITRDPDMASRKDTDIYLRRFDKFLELESMALEPLRNMSHAASLEDARYEVKERGLYYWDECIKVLDSNKALDLPLPVAAQNGKVLQYCKLRKQEYELVYKQLQDTTQEYGPKLQELENACNNILAELNQEAANSSAAK